MLRRVLRQAEKKLAGANRRPTAEMRRDDAADVPGAAALQAVRQSLLASLQGKTPSLERMLDTADELAVGGFITDAEHVLRRALETYPASVEPKRELARLALETNDAQRALHISLRAIEQHPNDLELHGMASAAYERLGAWIEASNHLAAVLAADSVNILANRRMAPILDRLGDRNGSIDCLRRLVAATQGLDVDAMTALGIALSGNGDHAEAIQLLSDVAGRRADSGSAHADLAMAQLSAGRLHEAVAGFSEALRLDPRSAQAYCGLGLAYQQLERWLEAAESFKIAEELAPDTAVGPFNLGLALAELDRPEEARRALLRAAALAPDDGEIRAALESLPPPAAPVQAAVAPAPRFIGDIKSFALPEVLEFLRLQHKTGSLVVSSRRGAGIVRLVKGQVTSASAPGIGRLGEALVARNIITRAQLDAVLAQQRRDDNAGDGDGAETLGDLLMRQRPGDREPLTRAVFQQVLDALEEMLAWKEGAFSFHPGADRGMPVIAFDLQNVMLEIMRLADERDATRSST
jgi:tetratricopeptide (TPR) repeat protein